MSRDIKFFVDGEYYHIYNRGVEKRKIFLSKRDYKRFLILFYLCNSTEPVHILMQDRQGLTLTNMLKTKRKNTLVDICVYCVMPNHFHLIIKEKAGVDGKSGISKFMQKLLTAYTMYFNIKNERTGSLFQGTFKAKHIDRNEYFQYLISYIHLNPIKLFEPTWKETGITDKKAAEIFLRKYQYSSYLDYCGEERPENILLNKNVLPEYYESVNDFKAMTDIWLSLDK